MRPARPSSESRTDRSGIRPRAQPDGDAMMINVHTDFLQTACMHVALALLVVLTAVPAFAQVDLTGVWAARNHEDLEGMLPGDYTGLPINDEARTRADSWLLSRSEEHTSELQSRSDL